MAARLPSRCAREAAGSHRRAALRNSCVMNRCLTRGALNCRSLSRCPSPSSHHLVSAYQSLTRHLCPLPTPCMSSASQLLYTEPCSIVLSIGFHHPNPRCRDCPLNRLTAPSSLSAPSTQHTMLVGKDLRGGELLMASRPLAIVLASPPQAPETTELLRELAVRCFSPAEQQVLEALRSQSVTQGSPTPPEFSQLHTGPQQQSQQSQFVDVLGTVEVALLKDVVERHALAVEAQDYPSCVVRGEEVRSALGVWPEVALIPHSCAPTVHEYLIGDTLFVRASGGLARGAQLTRNYLGMQAFTPLATRRALIEKKYGFRCACPRCAAEERNPEVCKAVEDAYVTAQNLSEAWVAAHDSSDTSAAAAVRDQIKGCVANVEGALRAAGVSYEEEVWLAAGVLVLYNLLFSMVRMCFLSDSSQLFQQAPPIPIPCPLPLGRPGRKARH